MLVPEEECWYVSREQEKISREQGF